MSSKVLRTSVALLVLVAGVGMTGCETLGHCPETALATTVTGAFGGYLIDEERGALLGAATGLLAGGIICGEQQRRLAAREEIEEAYEEETGDSVTDPYVSLEELELDPETIQAGEQGLLLGRYSIMGPPPAEPAKGTVRLWREGEELLSTPMESVEEGRMEIERTISIPSNLEGGEYEVEIEIENGESVARERRSFSVVHT